MRHMFSDLSEFRHDTLNFFSKRGNRAEEPLVKMQVGPQPVYLVTDPTLIKPIFKAEESDIDKGRLIYKLRQIIGHSSITLSGEAHRQRRAAIHRQLMSGLASDYVPEMALVIRQYAAHLAREKEVEAPRATAFLALRIICTILFGRGSLTAGDENAIVNAVHLVEDDLAEGMFRVLPHWPWDYVRKKRKLAEAREIMSVVVGRVRRYASAQSLFSALEELGLEGADLRDEILLMLLAGHHTSGTAATWLLYCLATQKDLAAAIAHEANAISNEAGELTPAAVKSANISRNFVQEVLRLYPSTFWLSREVKKPIELAGYRLKKGTSLLVSPWHFHRDPRFWDDPEEFNLNRSYAGPHYLPFGVGPRACVGTAVAMLELQLMALEFSAAFEIEVTSKVPADPPKPSVTLVPSDIRLRLRPRGASMEGVRAA